MHSDDTTHEADEPMRKSFNDDGDDTSTEAISPAKRKLLTEKHTASLAPDCRKQLKRNIKYVAFISQLDSRQEIPLILHQSFIEHKLKLRTLKQPEWKSTYNAFHQSMIAGTIQLNSLYGDERMNHVLHMTSLMEHEAQDEESGLSWMDEDWFKDYVYAKWKELNRKKNKTITIDITQLAANKAPLFINYHGKAPILKFLHDWVHEDVTHLIEIYQTLKNTNQNWGEAQISIYGIIFKISEAFFYWYYNLVSHTYNSQTKKYKKRRFVIGKNVMKWYNASYCNGNGLSYIMMFNAMDSNGNIHDLIKNGITDSMDVKVSLKKLLSNKHNQRAFLEHYIVSSLKFLIFFRVHQTGINGSWSWPMSAIHLPFHDMISVVKLVSQAMYHNELNEPIEAPLPKSNPKGPKLEYADTEQSKAWKTNQICQALITSICDPNAKSDSLHSFMLAYNISNHFWTQPASTASSIFTFYNVRSQGSKLSKARFRGLNDTEIASWRLEMQQMNAEKANAEFASLHIHSRKYETEILPELIATVQDNVVVRWGENGSYRTYVSDEICNETFAKNKYARPNNAWSGVNTAYIPQPILTDTEFYGDKIRCHNSKQWKTCNENIAFNTTAKMLEEDPNFDEFTIVDFGMATNGTEWFGNSDTESDSEAMMTQKDAIKLSIAKSNAKSKSSKRNRKSKLPSRPVATQECIMPDNGNRNVNDDSSDNDDDDDDDDDDSDMAIVTKKTQSKTKNQSMYIADSDDDLSDDSIAYRKRLAMKQKKSKKKLSTFGSTLNSDSDNENNRFSNVDKSWHSVPSRTDNKLKNKSIVERTKVSLLTQGRLAGGITKKISNRLAASSKGKGKGKGKDKTKGTGKAKDKVKSSTKPQGKSKGGTKRQDKSKYGEPSKKKQRRISGLSDLDNDSEDEDGLQLY